MKESLKSEDKSKTQVNGYLKIVKAGFEFAKNSLKNFANDVKNEFSLESDDSVFNDPERFDDPYS
jgi:hypothetical protein